VVAIRAGGLATSSVTCRAWRRGGRSVHHIVDPRTGDVPEPVWRTVSVAAGSCLSANAASTAAIVLGREAPRWLAGRGLPARLVGVDGQVSVVAGWPAEQPAAGLPAAKPAAGWPAEQPMVAR
jgi:thiamine biosynthesis lipoprotein